jgi:hypothetical protein
LKDAKISHDWGTNTVTKQGTCTIRTIHVTKILGVQTKRPKVLLVCYDFHPKIFDEEEDMMFGTKLDLFSIGTILVPTQIELISKLNIYRILG